MYLDRLSLQSGNLSRLVWEVSFIDSAASIFGLGAGRWISDEKQGVINSGECPAIIIVSLANSYLLAGTPWFTR